MIRNCQKYFTGMSIFRIFFGLSTFFEYDFLLFLKNHVKKKNLASDSATIGRVRIASVNSHCGKQSLTSSVSGQSSKGSAQWLVAG